jgi:hypothetical protein
LRITLFSVLVIGGILYAIFGNIDVGPSADAQKPVALACLKRAGFKADWDVPDDFAGGGGAGSGWHFDIELDVDDEDGGRVAVIYLADMSDDVDTFVDYLRDRQKTYGDYKDETIEARGTAAILLAKGSNRAGAIHDCVDRAAKAKET